MPDLDLPARPWIVGHRGVRGTAPENTVASLRQAVAQGADMVEVDVQLTADGKLVVLHDPAVRVGGRLGPLVGRATLEEVRRWRPVWDRDGEPVPYQIPTLEELLAAAPAELPLNLEIKRYGPGLDEARLIDALAGALAGRGGLLLSSFELRLLAKLRERLPDVPLAPLGGPAAGWDGLVALAGRVDAFSIHLHRRLASGLGRSGRLAEAAAAGRPVLAYTVNQPDEARHLLELGLAGLFTDRPGELRAGLEEG